MRERRWLLQERNQSKLLGHPVYLRRITAAGPECTSDPEDAVRFLSADGAIVATPPHTGTVFVPVVDQGTEGVKPW